MSGAVPATCGRGARYSGWAAFLCFAAFAVNVISGKIILVLGWGLAAPLDGPPEFILLLFSILFFTIYALYREREHNTNKNDC